MLLRAPAGIFDLVYHAFCVPQKGLCLFVGPSSVRGNYSNVSVKAPQQCSCHPPGSTARSARRRACHARVGCMQGVPNQGYFNPTSVLTESGMFLSTSCRSRRRSVFELPSTFLRLESVSCLAALFCSVRCGAGLAQQNTRVFFFSVCLFFFLLLVCWRRPIYAVKLRERFKTSRLFVWWGVV